MSDDFVTGSEFMRHVNSADKNNDRVTVAIEKIAEAQVKFTEYIISNDADKKAADKRMANLGETLDKVAKVIEAREDMHRSWKMLKWAGVIMITGALTAYGKNLYTVIEPKTPKTITVIPDKQ